MPLQQAMRIVEAAKNDLRYRAGVEHSDIIVSQIQAKEWPDTSLGCPEPHRTYQQVPTPGYIIVLGTKSREYEYHTDNDRRIVYCGKRLQG